MNDRKDTHRLYQSVLDEVHAPDGLKKRIKEMDTKQRKSNKIKYISAISAVAACLVVVMIITVVAGSFSGKGDSFVLKANAAEIGGEAFAEFAKVAPVSGESGGIAGETQTLSAVIPFSVKCEGRNIRSIKYSIENAVFLFPYDSFAYDFREVYPDEASASDKITGKTESNNKIDSNIEKDKQYSSYTVSFDDQIYKEFNNNYSEMDKFPIQLIARISSEDDISKEAKSALKQLHSGGSVTDESFLEEIMNDFRIIYDEMLGKVKVTAEITYEDGSTDSASLRFCCLGADEQNGIVIGAKTV